MNSPTIGAADYPLNKRMMVIKLRSKFVMAREMEQCRNDDDDHVFLDGGSQLKEKLNVHARMAHMHLLAAAYQRFKAEGFGEEPDS
jgi:hypothetical protein